MLLQQTCRHYWLIEPANSPVSLGLCRFCFETREFKNSIGNDWDSILPLPSEVPHVPKNTRTPE